MHSTRGALSPGGMSHERERTACRETCNLTQHVVDVMSRPRSARVGDVLNATTDTSGTLPLLAYSEGNAIGPVLIVADDRRMKVEKGLRKHLTGREKMANPQSGIDIVRPLPHSGGGHRSGLALPPQRRTWTHGRPSWSWRTSSERSR